DLVPVPEVRTDTVSGAASALANAGFAVSGVTGNPTATVTGTSPPAGALVHRGASVQILTT
ncbi:MAG: PASTA domain-containing protein, partial [Acidimicrobiaceae bacterium]|nr:PASTA domain-containing protein [Acidimicrobiaceae bacterium]